MNFMTPVLSIAINTFRQAIRNKVLASLVFFVVLASGATAILAEMSLHEERRVTANGVLFMSAIFGVVIAVHSSVTLLHTEIERRTLYTILSKPIARWQFLVGKFVGVGALLAAITASLSLLATALVAIHGHEVSSILFWAYYTLYLQLLIITAISLFYASFSTPLLSGMLTVAMFVAGNLTRQLEEARTYLAETSSVFDPIVDFLLMVLPDFQALNLSARLSYWDTVGAPYLASATWYAIAYSVVVLLLACGIFSRREFA